MNSPAFIDKVNGKTAVVGVVGLGYVGLPLIIAFSRKGFTTIGFDIDPVKFDRDSSQPVLPLEGLVDFVRGHNIVLGVIAVPDYAAQQVLELMLSAGIRGVLNFAPICLKAPEGCIVNNINLESELENLIYFVNALEDGK